jgi:hypothetical protein
MLLHGEDLLFQVLILGGLGATALLIAGLAAFRLIRKRRSVRADQ